MCSKQSINNKLQNFKIDDEESSIDPEMKKRRDDPLEHLLLSKRNKDNIPPPVSGWAFSFHFFTQLNVGFYPYYSLSDQRKRHSQGDKEEYLLDNGHETKIGEGKVLTRKI